MQTYFHFVVFKDLHVNMASKSRLKAAASTTIVHGYCRFLVDTILINIFTCAEYIPPTFPRQAFVIGLDAGKIGRTGMDEKPERVEGFRLLWPCFVATTFMWGAAMSLVVGMPEGSTAARAVALLGLSMIVLTFVVLHQINKR